MIPSDWVTAIPVIGAIVTIVGISIQVGKILQKLDYVIVEVQELKQDAKEIKTELKDHDKRLVVLEARQ
jgi:peptidase E